MTHSNREKTEADGQGEQDTLAFLIKVTQAKLQIELFDKRSDLIRRINRTLKILFSSDKASAFFPEERDFYRATLYKIATFHPDIVFYFGQDIKNKLDQISLMVHEILPLTYKLHEAFLAYESDLDDFRKSQNFEEIRKKIDYILMGCSSNQIYLEEALDKILWGENVPDDICLAGKVCGPYESIRNGLERGVVCKTGPIVKNVSKRR